MEIELAEPMIEHEDDNLYLDQNNDDDSSLEGEKCGICMDVVIDRGVLDSCQHWFCFTCIDNWATITNLCPLCQSEFQSITCVPVYDTIGSNNGDDDVLYRDDDWNIEGENNTLSFPSYYIDENAVMCLDGDGCKIRNGSVTIEDDPNLDTSIACDSCDTWYHAFCVGFDTEGTCETSWLCPRCIANERLEISSGSGHGDCPVEATLSGKVSISIADAGETAVVVSKVDRYEEMQKPWQVQYIENKHSTEGPNENLLPTSEIDKISKTEMLDSVSSIDFPKLEMLLENIRIQTLASQAASLSSPGASSEQSEKKAISTEIHNKEPSCFGESDFPSGDLLGEPCSRNEPCRRGRSHHLDLSESPSLSDDTKNDVAGEHSAENMKKESISECFMQDINIIHHPKDNALVVTGMKRKLRDHRKEETKSKVVTKASKKKVRVEETNGFRASGSQKRTTKREGDDSDIMSIIQESNHTLKEKAGRLRVKKIMRRDTKDKESSVLVENLRKEIREAVRIKSEVGENRFNPDLLAAFRFAVSGSVSESAKNSPALVLKAKRIILQKGKVREKLTKKIYGSGGKRKGGWTRDCEVEFWKHRCLQAGKPEKIDTLKSVLNLLRKSSDGSEVNEGEKGKGTNSILSRLYIADASVFPRKDDIKPLSDLDTNITPENIKPSTVENISTTTSSLGINILKTQQISKVSTQGVKLTNVKSDIVGKSEDAKTDKKKWALEILARKTAATSSKANSGVQEDDPVFRKSYPLLAQLPVDMRPVLAPSRHKKIPMSVRQAQLHRLTEHFLRKANLPIIRRTADTELAVADAVNIEKEIADKSSSKLVYTNLLSQQVSHRLENTNTSKSSNPSEIIEAIVEVPSSDPSVEESLIDAGLLSDPYSDPSVEDALKNAGFLPDPCSDPSVEEALKEAGFLSDSPPHSPCHPRVENDEATKPLHEIKGEEHDNILEVGSRSKVDVNNDLEENLKEEDFVGASAIKISKPQEEDTEIKVILSSFASDNLNPEDFVGASAIKISKPQEEDTKRKVILSSFALDNLNPEGLEEKSEVQVKECSQEDLTVNKGDGDIECGELHGSDKAPLVKKIPENEKLGVSRSSSAEKEPKLGTENCLEDAIPSTGVEEKPICSQTSENLPKGDKLADTGTQKQSDNSSGSISKKVEAYIKEHIRPLCKSGVITVEQYRWSVEKTTEKVMKYHSKEKNASFLIKEGDKVKKLAEQYVEASQHKKKK